VWKVLLNPSRVLVLMCLIAAHPGAAVAQRGTGELRLRVIDETGLAVQADGTIDQDATAIRRAFTTDEKGTFVADTLPFGVYRVQVTRSGFAPASASIDVRSEVPIVRAMTLRVAPLQTALNVTPAPGALVDAYRTGAVDVLRGDRLRDRPTAAPGRSIVDLVNSQAGWLLEANGILHPRGSEYQVQYVVDGIPLRDNRSPAFAQSLGIEEFESLTIRTAGYPAEFGGKLGGVIEVNTVRDPRRGFHGSAAADGASHGAIGGFFFGQYGKGGATGGVSLEALRTDRYLDPPVEANYSNTAAGGGVAAHVAQVWSDADRSRAYVQRRRTAFDVPNEELQQQSGQRQQRTTRETLAHVTHQHVFSPRAFGSVRFMARETGATLTSNALSIPIQPFEDRRLRELYVNADVSLSRPRHELKFGAEATFGDVDESFSATVTAYRLGGERVFDRELPAAFSFAARRPAREQALFAQDVVRLGPITASAGIRYDHYRLMVDEHAVSPRLSMSWHWPQRDLLVHASYDRAFQTPSVENVILSSSDLVKMLGGEGHSLTLRPSRGNFAEVGVSKALLKHLRLDASYYHRTASDFADDDVLLNTGISFPIAFARGTVRGYEVRAEAPQWGRASGSFAYSRMVGEGQLPISGGLFLGDEADDLLNATGTFALSQDQRHTVRGRVRYRLGARAWVAGSASYNSGLPTEVEGDVDIPFLTEQYGEAVVERADFDAGRVAPSASLDASFGWELFSRHRRSIRLQADVFNIADRLNVINFAGLLSGTAVGPRRTWALRMNVAF
jgi:hypothetical protein